jgi:undecaprenyl-diphosphatase
LKFIKTEPPFNAIVIAAVQSAVRERKSGRAAMSPALPHGWECIDRAERALCLRANRSCHRKTVRAGFAAVSRLGDGCFWYALMMVAIALAGTPSGPMVALRMAVAGLAATGFYKMLKRHCVRERPYIADPGILCGTAPLDRYSFPSGHTLHAVNFTVLAAAFEPWLLVVLAPFALAVAASRVVLGLHYPTDVAAGTLIGATISAVTMLIWPV